MVWGLGFRHCEGEDEENVRFLIILRHKSLSPFLGVSSASIFGLEPYSWILASIFGLERVLRGRDTSDAKQTKK